MEATLLGDILLLAALSVGVLIVCHRLGIPAIVGFLLAGVLGGPGSLGIISSTKDVEMLANLGIILLLFTIGLEFSVRKIVEFRRYFLLGGALQVALTVLGGFVIAKAIGRPTAEALFLGFLLSMSSTAIVLKILQDRSQTSTPAGKAILGILIFQDVVAIPMMLMIPVLAGKSEIHWGLDTLLRIGGGVVLLAAVVLSAIYLMPRLLDVVTRTRSPELFLLTILVSCFSVAWLTSQMGLSLSIGAFLAGLMISDSEYSTEAIGDILPFRHLFTSFFFVSIGMLCDVNCLFTKPALVFALTGGVLLLKATLAGLSVQALGLPLKAATLGGLALAQVGEFSFVLAKSGADIGLGSIELNQLFLDVSLLTMALTPLLIYASEPIAAFLLRLPFPHSVKSGFRVDTMDQGLKHLKDHVVIVGFGIAGQNLARALKEQKIPYTILEMNSDTVKKEKAKGESIHYGDATHDSVLKHLGTERARAIAVLINDPVAALRATSAAHHLNPSLYIIARVHRVQEIPLMLRLGASDVIADEFGASVEVFTRVLRLYQTSWEEIDLQANEIRSEGYEMMHRALKEPLFFSENLKIKVFRVHKGSPFVNKTLEEVQFRASTGLTIVMIKRNGETLYDINKSTTLQEEDRVTLVGSQENLNKIGELFEKNPHLTTAQ